VIVEYTGNGPWTDHEGDVSTGRPEDSNLGWGMAEEAGTEYIWWVGFYYRILLTQYYGQWCKICKICHVYCIST
jgi:hypothetical protein